MNNSLSTIFGSAIVVLVGWIAVLLWDKFKTVNKRVDKRRTIEGCDGIHSVVEEKLSSMNGKMDILLQNKVAQSQSLRKLTPYGEKLLKFTGIKKIFDEVMDDTFELIKKSKPKNYFQIEVKTDKLMQRLKDESSTNDRLKKIAENANVPIDLLLFIGSVYISSKYINDHSKLLVSSKSK